MEETKGKGQLCMTSRTCLDSLRSSLIVVLFLLFSGFCILSVVHDIAFIFHGSYVVIHLPLEV